MRTAASETLRLRLIVFFTRSDPVKGRVAAAAEGDGE
ncbi:hypothetical protein BH24GEM2_BH24GEM2_18540 [soil metagenome]